MLRVLAVAAGLFVLVPGGWASTDGPIRWQHDYAAALREAKAANKLLLINVHTSWCGPCKQLQATTLKDPALVQLISKNCIPLSLDGDANSGLIQRLGVRAFPTQVFVSPDGRIVGRIEGFRSADAYASTLAVSLAQVPQKTNEQIAQVSPAPSVAKPSPVAQTPPQPPIRPQAGTFAAAAMETKPTFPTVKTTPQARAVPKTDRMVQPCSDDAPLAMKGFCPVSMIAKAQLIEGDASTCVTYDGKRYIFRTKQELAAFEKDPEKYLPGADGVCLVTLLDSGKVADGSVDWPAIFENQVYFFANGDDRRKFLLDPEKYVLGWRQASRDHYKQQR